MSNPDAPKREPLKRRVARLAQRLAIVYLLVLLIAMLFEERLIFFPSKFPEGDWTPAGLTAKDVSFAAHDGVVLHGWYCPIERPRAVLLFAHGNAGNVTHRAERIRMWQERLGVSVFAYDYRGYGRSGGSPDEKGVYADARAAYRCLTEQLRVRADQIVLWGESLGSAVSLELALEAPHRALVMESPFTSAVDIGARAYPWLPVRLCMRNRFDSLAKIGKHNRPLLIVHGEDDSIVPVGMGRTLFERAGEPKSMFLVPGADHNDLPWAGGADYFRALAKFLDSVDDAPR